MAKGTNQKQANGFELDFEAQLWAAADKMRGHMDASEYTLFRPSPSSDCITDNAFAAQRTTPKLRNNFK